MVDLNIELNLKGCKDLDFRKFKLEKIFVLAICFNLMWHTVVSTIFLDTLLYKACRHNHNIAPEFHYSKFNFN